jgi:predicted ester cyclase
VQTIINQYKAFNSRDFRALENCLSPTHVDRTYFGKQAVSREAIMRMFAGFLEAFPDWTEAVDEIIVTDNNQMAVRHTGRGTQRKRFLGREPTGRQLAAYYIEILTFDDDDRILEYKSSFPFTNFFEETIVAAEDIMEARAEQGGSKVAESVRFEVLEAYRDGLIDSRDVVKYKSGGLSVKRCEALLEENLRRCYNEAAGGSLYCVLHQSTGFGPGVSRLV